MEPEIRAWPSILVAGVRTRAQPGVTDFGALWGVLGSRGVERLPRPAGARAFGVASNFDEKSNSFDYLAGYEIESGRDVPKDFDVVSLPAGTYAAFWTTLPNLMETIRLANHDWLPASTYRRGEGAEFELYDERFDPGAPDSPMAIVIPVVAG
jgi:predicted transcriptional regulator YdeE